MSKLLQSAVWILGFAWWFWSSVAVAQSDIITDPWQTPEARQFDFWIGEWDVNLRIISKDIVKRGE